MAEFLRYDFEPGEAPDVESFLPILMGEPMPTERRAGYIQHSISGQFAIVDTMVRVAEVTMIPTTRTMSCYQINGARSVALHASSTIS